MKGYQTTPFIVIGGCAGDFLGEYMAGGVILLLGLGLNEDELHKTKFVGTGMHGGVIYVRGEITHVGEGAQVLDVDKNDMRIIYSLIKQFCDYFGFAFDEIARRKFTKIVPVSRRPYGKLYTS